MRICLVQLNSSDDPDFNLPITQSAVAGAAAEGAEFILTPEVTNLVSADRAHQVIVLHTQENDPTLKGLQSQAAHLGVWILIGSLALKTSDPDGRFANRSFLISPDGDIAATYDKIHMFDVKVSESESYRESRGYRPGDTAQLAHTTLAPIGMTICYDVRFPHLFRDLAQAGAQMITVPSAFSPVTGAAHWETLLRARAIETGCFVLAPAQTGHHISNGPRTRDTYGHSMAVDPWGKVLVDMGTTPGFTVLDLDMTDVSVAQGKIPALTHDRTYQKPT